MQDLAHVYGDSNGLKEHGIVGDILEGVVSLSIWSSGHQSGQEGREAYGEAGDNHLMNLRPSLVLCRQIAIRWSTIK